MEFYTYLAYIPISGIGVVIPSQFFCCLMLLICGIFSVGGCRSLYLISREEWGMKKGLLLALLVSICLVGVASASSQGGGHGGEVHWGYHGETGPAHWGDLSADFHMCKDGKSQTPIDIVGAVSADQPALTFNYENTTLSVINNGHTIKANYSEGSSISVDGETYQLLQFHFHSLSENKVEGQYFPLEAHLVHKSAAGKLAVVGVLFEEGTANPLLDRLWGYTPSKVNSTTTVATASINVSDLLPANADYYGFTGSLTTPPCSEGVKWMVLQNPITVSSTQIAKFRSFFNDMETKRPIQAMNGRVVYK